MKIIINYTDLEAVAPALEWAAKVCAEAIAKDTTEEARRRLCREVERTLNILMTQDYICLKEE